jgi:hypothetical protein
MNIPKHVIDKKIHGKDYFFNVKKNGISKIKIYNNQVT